MGAFAPAVGVIGLALVVGAEVEERRDFTERLLARERDPDRLAPPR